MQSHEIAIFKLICLIKFWPSTYFKSYSILMGVGDGDALHMLHHML